MVCRFLRAQMARGNPASFSVLLPAERRFTREPGGCTGVYRGAAALRVGVFVYKNNSKKYDSA